MQLTVRNVTLGYEQSVVSEKINFEMGQGDYLCVVGENGAGKSTVSYTHLCIQTDAKALFQSGFFLLRRCP